MIVDTVDKLEQPLAHMLPEITANVFTPLCIIILLFILDWRMALACMIVIPIGFLLLMGQRKTIRIELIDILKPVATWTALWLSMSRN